MLPSQFKTLVEMLRTELSAIKEAVQKQERAQSDSRKAADQQWSKVPGIIASAIRPTHNEVANTQARYDQSYRQQERAIKIQVGLRMAAWAAFAGAVVYAAVAMLQVVITRQQLHMDQRPWLKVSMSQEGQLTFRAGDPFYMPITVANIGKTPAENVTVGMAVILVAVGENPYIPRKRIGDEWRTPFWWRWWWKIPGGRRKNPPIPASGFIVPIIYQGDSVRGIATRLQFASDGTSREVQPLTPAEIQALVSKRDYFVIYGTTWYYDVFKTSHWATFCLDQYADGSSGYNEKCAHYGEADNSN